MDSSKCQTLTATPAEPGELPTELAGMGQQIECSNRAASELEESPRDASGRANQSMKAQAAVTSRSQQWQARFLRVG